MARFVGLERHAGAGVVRLVARADAGGNQGSSSASSEGLAQTAAEQEPDNDRQRGRNGEGQGAGAGRVGWVHLEWSVRELSGVVADTFNQSKLCSLCSATVLQR